ncbi:YjzD family protein [Lacticaseibacillus saniviri]|uniref:DUF2929 domain-containing protein n=1 Tax=Lacticaseibacillus saniviri JCM 17471 = DSM 24301 TaxID=1293598 RepID=A0A0R2N5F2_9LACO|nr:YjzD family protein [Lacticaseibacillus saniviri]KRO18298.1 hypothetical protein IV56_GL001429 [Lacticaseibacillus saniviri JCM 17471 = DSM 24301]MCG4282763.1 YjzD family protein [Lacticaseibacillus saniviri]
MRYIATLFWGSILGEVIGFLLSALNGTQFNPQQSLIVSVIFVIILFMMPAIMKQFDTTASKS